MDFQFNNVKILIWDFDGTLYRPNPELFHAVREAEYKTIMRYTGWDREKTVAEFEKNYKKVTPSATEAVAFLSSLTTTQAALEMESYFDRRTYLSRDQKLVDLFSALSGYQHYMLANGTKKNIVLTLVALGLDKNKFQEIVTSEIVGVNKPHEEGFRYILKKTGLFPGQHLMIGDRELVDLVPAKKLGMKTCLVWSTTPSAIADITLQSVYDVAEVLS